LLRGERRAELQLVSPVELVPGVGWKIDFARARDFVELNGSEHVRAACMIAKFCNAHANNSAFRSDFGAFSRS
jgi:hypothetical protein